MGADKNGTHPEHQKRAEGLPRVEKLRSAPVLPSGLWVGSSDWEGGGAPPPDFPTLAALQGCCPSQAPQEKCWPESFSIMVGGGGSLRLGAPQCLRKARTTSHYTAPLQSCLLPMEAPVIEKRQCAPEPGHCTRWPLSCCSRPRSGDEDQWKERIALGVLDLARNQASTDSVFLVWWPENETWNPSFLGSVSLPCHILGSLTSVT